MAVIRNPCSACGKEAENQKGWNVGHFPDGLLSPPKDLAGSPICNQCWKQGGKTMEARIRTYQRSLVQSISLINICNDPGINPALGFSNQIFPELPRIHMPDGTDGLNCAGCQDYHAYVVSNSIDGYKCGRCR